MALDLADNSATNAAKTVLTKHYGPLPFWAWLAVVGVTVYGVKYYTGKRNAKEDIPLDSSNAMTPYTDSNAVQPDNPMYGGGFLTSAGTGTSTVGTDGQNTNQSWLSRAVSILGSGGQWDSYKVSSTLQKYLNGIVLSDPTEREIVSTAIEKAGATPSPVGISNTGFDTNTAGDYIPDLRVLRIIQGRLDPDYKGQITYVDGHLTDQENGGVYAQYSDGSIRSFETPAEVWATAKSSGLIDQNGQPIIETLAVRDPIWQRATEGWGITVHKGNSAA